MACGGMPKWSSLLTLPSCVRWPTARKSPVVAAWCGGVLVVAKSESPSNKLVLFLLLLVVSSCYRGGGRREMEELGWWWQVLLPSLLPELDFCGSACCSPATRPVAWIGACLPPMCHLAGLQDPGVRARWILRRLQRGFLLHRSKPATQLLFFDVFFSGVSSARARAAADGSLMQRGSTVGLDLVVFSLLFGVLFVKWGQLPRIWIVLVISISN